MYPVLSSAILCVLIHVFAIALCATAFGVTIREVSVGLGPTAFNIGRLTFRALPFGGAVRFKDSREERIDPADMRDALDGRSAFVQVVIGLSGGLALLLVAVATLGAAGLREFVEGFGQIVVGAASPLVLAQGLIAKAQQIIVGLPFLAVFGMVAAKLAAYNLMPLPGANGGFVIATIARGLGFKLRLPDQLAIGLTVGLTLVYFALALCWLGALIVYLID